MRFRRRKCCFAHTEKTDQRHSVGGDEKFEIRNSTTWVRFVFQECSQDVYGKSLELWDMFFVFVVCFFVVMKPENPSLASRPETLYVPTEVNTLHVDELACIPRP